MPVNDVALIARRQDRLTALRTITASNLSKMWVGLDSYVDDVDWLRRAGLVVGAGQSRAVDMQVATLQALLADRLTFDRAGILDMARIDLGQPFIAFANALDSGLKFDEAVEAGRLRAEGVGESSVQWAARAANQAAEGDERIVGWTRTLGPGSCDWCITVSTQRYRSSESASFGHLRCTCAVDPIIGTRDPGRVLNNNQATETVDE